MSKWTIEHYEVALRKAKDEVLKSKSYCRDVAVANETLAKANDELQSENERLQKHIKLCDDAIAKHMKCMAMLMIALSTYCSKR